MKKIKIAEQIILMKFISAFRSEIKIKKKLETYLLMREAFLYGFWKRNYQCTYLERNKIKVKWMDGIFLTQKRIIKQELYNYVRREILWAFLDWHIEYFKDKT